MSTYIGDTQVGFLFSGEDGKTAFIHIRYSNDGGKTFSDSGDYIGFLCDYKAEPSTAPSDYSWSRYKPDMSLYATTDYVKKYVDAALVTSSTSEV